MTFWTWIFLCFFFVSSVPLAWIVAQAVGMERVSWGRATIFAGLEALAAFFAMKALPLDFFVLKVVAGVFSALFVSPLAFRLLMTRENARALLGSVLLTVVSVGGVVLIVLF